MIPKSFVALLVVSMVVLIVSFGVVMGAYAIAASTGDLVGGKVTWTAAMILAVLLVIVTLLLTGTLGVIYFLDATEDRPPPRRRRRGPR